MDRVRAGHPEAEALHIAPGLDVPELAGIVEGAEQAVLGPDDRDGEWRRQERAVHHDGRADAVHARARHDALRVHGDRLRAAAPRGVEDVGQVRRVADGLIEVRRAGGDRVRVVELHDDAVARDRAEAGLRLEIGEPLLELARRAALARGVGLDLIELRPQVLELDLEVVLLLLESEGRVGEWCVVADGDLTALLLTLPLRGDQEAEQRRRQQEGERVLQALTPRVGPRRESRHRSSVTRARSPSMAARSSGVTFGSSFRHAATAGSTVAKPVSAAAAQNASRNRSRSARNGGRNTMGASI